MKHNVSITNFPITCPTTQKKDHLWVYDLKLLDTVPTSYTSQCLVIVRCDTKRYLKSKSWDEVQQLNTK